MTNGSARDFREHDRDGYARSGVTLANREPLPSKYAAINALTYGRHVVYAMRLPDGVIKIGCCKDLARRSYGLHGDVLGFMFGDFADEADIHASLIEHRARGHEYYHPTAEVMAVVNRMRDAFGLEHLAA